LADEGFKRKLAAILSADVEGYSRLMDDNEEATVHTLTAYRSAITDLTQQFRGRVVDSPGDNILAEFSSVVDAVNSAVEIQRELAERNAELPYNRKMEFRIGVNLGDVIEEDGRIYGDGVNIAARVESLAEAGGICISGEAYDHVAKKLGLEYENLGEHQLKNISTPIRVYRLLSYPGAAAHRVISAKKEVGRTWHNVLVATVPILVVAAAAAVWHFYFRTPPMEVASVERMAYQLPDEPSIAVLPFDNMSGDPKQEYISDGLTDQIITSLSMIPRLFVIARNSTFTYKSKAVKVQKVAEELGVRYVLEGSVQRSEDRVRILVQLIDAISGRHLWSERYDRDLNDIFALQDEIAKQIMTALQVKLTEGEYASGIAKTTSNLKALEFFWRAEELFIHFAESDNAEARRWAEKAIKLDPNFAGAWALIGWTHLADAGYRRTKSPVQSIKQAGEFAKKAIALDETNGKAYMLVGYIQLIQRNHDEAIRYGQKAVSLNPNDPMLIAILAMIMDYSGRFEEAITLFKKAMRLTPYYPAFIPDHLCSAYITAGRYAEAIENCELALERSRKGELDPLTVHKHLAAAYAGLGQEDEATAHAAEVLKINPNFSLSHLQKGSPFNPIQLKSRFALYRKAGLPE
jgi:TolB-like protein/class 3 adenylate cyclase/Tfp pilus assembly protein PilF